MLKQHLGAIAIVFDFVNPVIPLWWLIDRGSKLWLYESEGHEACTYRRSPDGGCQGFVALPRGEMMMMAGKPSPSPNYHLTAINQP
jgi:hypothetical protein